MKSRVLMRNLFWAWKNMFWWKIECSSQHRFFIKKHRALSMKNRFFRENIDFLWKQLGNCIILLETGRFCQTCDSSSKKQFHLPKTGLICKKWISLPKNWWFYQELDYYALNWIIQPKTGIFCQQLVCSAHQIDYSEKMDCSAQNWNILPKNGFIFPKQIHLPKNWINLPNTGLFHPSKANNDFVRYCWSAMHRLCCNRP